MQTIFFLVINVYFWLQKQKQYDTFIKTNSQ